VLTLPPAVHIYVATSPCDLRKSFDGLSIAVGHALGHDPTSGHLFCFFNKRATQVRVLFWDRTGWCIFAKRLARGRFHLSMVRAEAGACVQMDSAELSLLLEGIDLAGATRRKRYRRDSDADHRHDST
jgi:transposase